MGMKNAIIAVVALLVIAAGVFAYAHRAQAPQPQSGTQQPTDNKVAANWTFADKGEDAQGIPQTEVSFNGRVVGTYQGSCSEISGTSWQLLPGELSGVICWYAGGGKEVGFFANEGGGYDVMVGDLDEGSAESSPVRGNFKTAFTL